MNKTFPNKFVEDVWKLAKCTGDLNYFSLLINLEDPLNELAKYADDELDMGK